MDYKKLCETEVIKNVGEKTRIIYISEFGSHLYGLNTTNSDTDLICIYVPHIDDLITEHFNLEYKNIAYFSLNSKEDKTNKNTPEDFDVKFFSIQEVLRRLALLDNQMCDILFSFTNKEKIIFNDTFNLVFENYKNLIDIPNNTRFLSYAMNQIKKYGPKNSAVGIAKKIISTILITPENKNQKLGDIFEEKIFPIVKKINEDELNTHHCEYFYEDDKITGIKLFNKVHHFNLRIHDFVKRIEKFYDEYGKRAEAAKKNIDIDWKACSHAYRAVINYISLVNDGIINFPYTGEKKELLMNIKAGKISWTDFEKLFIADYESVFYKKNIKSNYDYETSLKILKSFY